MWTEMLDLIKGFYTHPKKGLVISYAVCSIIITASAAATSLLVGGLSVAFLGAGVPILFELLRSE